MTIAFFDGAAAYRELSAELDDAWRRVMSAGRYILGPEVEAFEAEFAAHCGVRHAVGVGNGLDALTLVLKALGIGPGDEVIVPANTFVATWLAVAAAGAEPVAAEPGPETHTIDAESIAGRVTPRTRAIVPVHLYGQPADMALINALARRHNLAVVEDAAQAHGACYRGRRVGGLAAAAGFSFYPTKTLGGFGDGGAVVTDDGELAARVRRLGNYGSERRYVHSERGVNSRLDELQAALLRVRLRHLDAWNERRRSLAHRYQAGLAGLPALRLPAVPEWADPVWHLMVVRTARRDALAAHLRGCGIETLIHYPIPPYRQEGFRHLAGRYPEPTVSDLLAGEVLSLPLGPHMAADEVDAVVGAVRGFFETPDAR